MISVFLVELVVHHLVVLIHVDEEGFEVQQDSNHSRMSSKVVPEERQRHFRPDLMALKYEDHRLLALAVVVEDRHLLVSAMVLK